MFISDRIHIIKISARNHIITILEKKGKNYSQQKFVLLEEGYDLSPVESSCVIHVVPYEVKVRKLNGPWMMCLHG